MDLRISLGHPQDSQALSCGARQVRSHLKPEKQCQSSCLVDNRICGFLEVPQVYSTCHRVLSRSLVTIESAGWGQVPGAHWDIGPLEMMASPGALSSVKWTRLSDGACLIPSSDEAERTSPWG